MTVNTKANMVSSLDSAWVDGIRVSIFPFVCFRFL